MLSLCSQRRNLHGMCIVHSTVIVILYPFCNIPKILDQFFFSTLCQFYMIFRSCLVGAFKISSHMMQSFQENYCDALRQVYNETSLREVDINHLLEISIASDIVGGGELRCIWNSLYHFGLGTTNLCLCIFKTSHIRAYGLLFFK